MSAVVNVIIEGPEKSRLEGAAVLNGGFSSPSPHVLMPRQAALVLFPDYPAGTIPTGGATAGGSVTFRATKQPVSVRVKTENREGPFAICRVLIGEQEDEILLSDYAIDALGVMIEKHGEGLWRFSDERQIRSSVSRQHW